jgi:transposase
MSRESLLKEEPTMRGDDQQQADMFSYISPERRVPEDHPLRAIRRMVDAALAELSPRFASLYAATGRPSIAPEKLLRALILQVLYTVRSERLLMEELDYNLLFRWFVGLNMDDAVWDATVFTKNRERLLEGDIAQAFFDKVLKQARTEALLSDEHFTVDGTLVEAWAGHKSFKPRGGEPAPPPDDPGNPTVDFTGQKRSNKTHVSTTDPEARLYRKSFGTESKLCYAGHILMDNRHGLAVNARLTQADGRAERETAVAMLRRIWRRRRATLGADKAYDVAGFVRLLRRLKVTPHIAAKRASYSAIDGRTTRHDGYAISQRRRKRVEEIFGWLKTVALMRKTRHRGKDRVGWMFTFAVAAYNLVRMRKLLPAST